MTHDKLLERLDDQIEKSKLIGCECPACDNAIALRAVVELHKPIEEEGKLWCRHEICYDHIEFLERDNCDCSYPCPTIQAIEEKLG